MPGGFTIFQNKLYILGGFDIPGGISTNQIWEFTPGTNAWVQKATVCLLRSATYRLQPLAPSFTRVVAPPSRVV